MELTLSEATGITASAIAKAEAIGVKVGVAICGRDGRLVAFSKMDGAGQMTARRAIGKAIASSISGQSSEVHPGDTITPGSPTVGGEGMAAFHEPGGLALTRNGALIGAIGVHGDATPDQDVACATAGVANLRPMREERKARST